MSELVRLETVTDHQGVGTEMPTIADGAAERRDNAWKKFVGDMIDFAKDLQKFCSSLHTRSLAVLNNMPGEGEKQGKPPKGDPSYSHPESDRKDTTGPTRVATSTVHNDKLSPHATHSLRRETPIAMTWSQGSMDDLRKDDPRSSYNLCRKSPATGLRSETAITRTMARVQDTVLEMDCGVP